MWIFYIIFFRLLFLLKALDILNGIVNDLSFSPFLITIIRFTTPVWIYKKWYNFWLIPCHIFNQILTSFCIWAAKCYDFVFWSLKDSIFFYWSNFWGSAKPKQRTLSSYRLFSLISFSRPKMQALRYLLTYLLLVLCN